MTLWQYPLRGRQVFVGSGALVPARKKICVLVALKTVTMQQICLNISYASSMWCGSILILILKTSRLRRFDGFLLPTNLFGWWSPSPQFGARLLLNFGATLNPGLERRQFPKGTASERYQPDALPHKATHHHWHFLLNSKTKGLDSYSKWTLRCSHRTCAHSAKIYQRLPGQTPEIYNLHFRARKENLTLSST